jgi:hypothetical protein
MPSKILKGGNPNGRGGRGRKYSKINYSNNMSNHFYLDKNNFKKYIQEIKYKKKYKTELENSSQLLLPKKKEVLLTEIQHPIVFRNYSKSQIEKKDKHEIDLSSDFILYSKKNSLPSYSHLRMRETNFYDKNQSEKDEINIPLLFAIISLFLIILSKFRAVRILNASLLPTYL